MKKMGVAVLQITDDSKQVVCLENWNISPEEVTTSKPEKRGLRINLDRFLRALSDHMAMMTGNMVEDVIVAVEEQPVRPSNVILQFVEGLFHGLMEVHFPGVPLLLCNPLGIKRKMGLIKRDRNFNKCLVLNMAAGLLRDFTGASERATGQLDEFLRIAEQPLLCQRMLAFDMADAFLYAHVAYMRSIGRFDEVPFIHNPVSDV